MAYEIAKKPMGLIPKKRPEKRGSYLAWLHRLPCCVTGQNGVEAAHISFAAPWYGHYGRGRGTKAPDRFALPVSSEAHKRQHSMAEGRFWAELNMDPHCLANTLFGIWSDYPEAEATEYATARIYAGLAAANRLPEGI